MFVELKSISAFFVSFVYKISLTNNINLKVWFLYTAKTGVLKWHQCCKLYSSMVFILGELHNMNTSGVDFNTQFLQCIVVFVKFENTINPNNTE